ncbi:TIGR01777 family protein [Chitinophaga sp. SYP-B3965]|uniref:TIGR01777 family oxidoreductase n=1 Tax=Chitinophaga sp. SYP-B3965 TaxID=2663120 RepID=UPI001299CDF0|nr:TIGR01777 family oxidoreductase [Chitinophaga sp. SYP-B3965]MRG47612.1 TIGR01777 family protein [Chitinophaga sp. SYP-B3965]
MQNKKIVIAGGTGFIGESLIDHFGSTNRIIILSRKPQPPRDHVTYAYWDGKNIGEWAQLLEGTDLLINLAGKSVNCRYTEENKAAILASRIESTQVLGEAVKQLKKPPTLWINSGSATIYRHSEDKPMDEFTGEIRNDFSVQVCKRWEQSFNDIRLTATRKVILRIAVTLGKQGSVMIPYLNMIKFGLGGFQGSGRQMYSWVHVTDLARMMEWLYEHPECSGTYNCAAPNPVTNKAFMTSLRKATGSSFGLPAYTWMLKIGAQLIGTETELLLKSRWVIPTRITHAGFTFQYPELPAAFQQIISELPRKQYKLLV